MQILLAGKPFTAVRSVNLTREAETPKHTLESGADVSDHVILRPAAFELELELLNDLEDAGNSPHDYGTLQDLYEARTPITFVSPQGVWENMLVATLSDRFGHSTNTTRATVTLHQVLIVESQTVALDDDLAGDVKVGPDERFTGPVRAHLEAQQQYLGQRSVGDLAAQRIPDTPEPGTNWAHTLLLYAPEVEAMKNGPARR